MKKKMLRSIWLRVCMIVAVVTTAFSGTAWAEIHPIDVEVEGFTATSGQIDGNISYSTTGGAVSGSNLTATTFTLTATNGAKINSVSFHWTVGWSEIACVTSDATTYFVANVNEDDLQNPTVSGLNCNEIVFRPRYSGTGPGFDYIKVTYTPGTPAYTVTAQSSDESKGTVEVDGNVIIATPNHGYGVDESNPYTIKAGEATVTPYQNNEFDVVPTSNCTIVINFVAHAADSKVNFEHNLDSYTDWTYSNIVRSVRSQQENAHGGSGYYGKPSAQTAWFKTVGKVEYPGTFTCFVRKTEWQQSLTWKIQVSSNGSDWTDVNTLSHASTTATPWEEFITDLSMYTDVYVRLYYEGSSVNGAIDDIVLTEETATVPVSVSSYGYSTFCSHRALDFTNSSINVYYATAEGEELTFHKITKLPADTGVLLQKAGGVTDEEVPALVGEADAVTGNVFVPGAGAAVSYSDEDQNYILYHGEILKAKNNNVATSRAYIHLPNGNGVKDFSINLEADVTGIKTIDDAQSTMNDAIYNLAGQRLKKMQKGINIVNGKKMVIK